MLGKRAACHVGRVKNRVPDRQERRLHEAPQGHFSVYAPKKMDKDALVGHKAVGDAHTERNIFYLLGSAAHDAQLFILILHSAFQMARRVHVVMELDSGGELVLYLRRKAVLSQDDSQCYKVVLFVTLETPHDMDVMHRDIKPENVLLDGDCHVVLTSFELAKERDKSSETRHS